MQRRRYLALTSSFCLAGCATLNASDSSSPGSASNSTGDPTPPQSTDPDDGPSTDDPALAGRIDDFESLDPWDPLNATLSADASRSVVGTQSARLEIPAAERSGGISTSFAEPRDLSDTVPGLAVAADGLVVPWLRLIDDDGNELDYRRGIKGTLPLVRYNFGVETVADGFDPTAVREVFVLVRTNEGERRTVWIDDFHLVARPDTGCVMIQFDDAHVTDYTTALPILEEYGYPAVSFVNPGRIEAETRGADDPGGFPRLTVDQVHELHDAGWVIGNHCYSHPHLSELDTERQDAEISRGKAWLEAEGFTEGARYFAYPHGDYDERTLALVEEYHDIGFAGGRPVQGYAVNPRQTSRIGEPSVERARTAVERTASMRAITSLFFHRLEGDSLAAFEAALEAIDTHETAGELEVILPPVLEREYLYHV
ncbi:polysaccharide deacetylase family protein [Natrinema longum]|uniref:Polysaccharide deacetylase family protein n=1 Tax=Natrinema longum TaxID=370324 RepID=A0A8A2UCM3_9EURY|nr:polysaccharide deacetylase family protein [Natrinema longum]MBZ6495469.1 polysaccharide deacetylase family protein [Natrinema longum]QSW86561.1 polysaccharide deacetylase family protein [Natrinema longum]